MAEVLRESDPSGRASPDHAMEMVDGAHPAGGASAADLELGEAGGEGEEAGAGEVRQERVVVSAGRQRDCFAWRF
jgi:hypothetical protein